MMIIFTFECFEVRRSPHGLGFDQVILHVRLDGAEINENFLTRNISEKSVTRILNLIVIFSGLSRVHESVHTVHLHSAVCLSIARGNVRDEFDSIPLFPHRGEGLL